MVYGPSKPNPRCFLEARSRTIGAYASHGCVRMFNEDVIDLYNLVSIGTPVRII
jgi:lipoprotein-anchoring transpeptidase ErfK/SrfK